MRSVRDSARLRETRRRSGRPVPYRPLCLTTDVDALRTSGHRSGRCCWACVLFDGNTSEANLIGIEYIVSESLFGTLPEEERGYWNPHNYEILSGQLIAPGLPAFAEQQLMAELVNSYGKTWHTWHTGRHDTGGGHPLPLGDPMLMWSFNRDGESDPDLASDRARVLGLDPDATRERRQQLLDRAHPQHGVDALASEFSGTTPIPGVREAAPGHDREEAPDASAAPWPDRDG